mmetsp:Transcript_47396/g.55374  ORF Transcript_47396/g.55374 Transcript_47396/m.55374 type:complete len:106 (+) Transcript_47396:544-861(+)
MGDVSPSSKSTGDEPTPALTKYVDQSKQSYSSRTALEIVIESGEWEAAGEVVAKMSDPNLTNVSTGNDDTPRSGLSSRGSVGKGGGRGVGDTRVNELDHMIDKRN